MLVTITNKLSQRRIAKQEAAQQRHNAQVDGTMATALTAFKNGTLRNEPVTAAVITLVLSYFTIHLRGEQAYLNARINRTFPEFIIRTAADIFKEDKGYFDTLHLKNSERERMLGVVEHVNKKLKLA